MATAFNLEGKLGLNIASFKNKLNESSKNLNTTKAKFKKSTMAMKRQFKGVAKSIKSVSKVVLGLGTAIGVGLVSSYKNAAEAADLLAKNADKIGINPERLVELRHNAQLLGVNFKTVDVALEKASKRLGEFNTTGSGAAAQWLKEFNYDTEELAKLAPDQLFHKYAESIRGLSTRGEKLAAVSALMGDKARQMLLVIDQTPEAFKKTANEAHMLGLTMTRIDLAKIEAANDEILRAQSLFKGFGNTLAVAVAPVLETLVNKFKETVIQAGGFGKIVPKIFNSVIGAVEFVADAVNGLVVVWKGLKVVALGFSTALIGALDLGIKALAKFGNSIVQSALLPLKAVLSLLSNFSDTAKEALESINNFKIEPPEFLGEAFQSQMDALILAKTEFNTAMLSPVPSERIKDFVAEVEKASKALEKTTSIAVDEPSAPTATPSEVHAESIDKMIAKNEEFSTSMKSALGSEVSGFLSGEFDSIGDSFAGMLKDMVSKAITADISSFLGLGGGGGAGGAGGGGGAGGLMQMASMFFAEGGNPPMNKAAIVGENGPEMIVPRGNSTVIPNHEMGGGGGSVTNNFNITTRDAQSFKQSKAKISADASRSLGR